MTFVGTLGLVPGVRVFGYNDRKDQMAGRAGHHE
jgi:hypothetical protein